MTPEPISEMVARLREEAARNGGQGAYAWRSRELCGKAAELIEAQAAEIRRIRNVADDHFRNAERLAKVNAAQAAEIAALQSRVDTVTVHLAEAVERVEAGDLDQRMCCDGYMCGCMGSTYADQFLHYARAALD